MNEDRIIGGLWVVCFFIVVYLLLLLWKAFIKLSYDYPATNQSWRVGDFRHYFDGLPDDMPVILLDVSTDDEDCNYHFTNEEIEINDYYILGSDDALEGIPAGKAVYLHFDNRLNENPIN